MGKVAEDFSTAKAYAKDDLCIYGGVLYRFTAAHSAGAWTGTDAAAMDSTLQMDIERILSGMDKAEKATAYAGTVVFEPEQISGTRYKYILTNAPDPR